MRRYQAASRRGSRFVDHDTRTPRVWMRWLLKEVGIPSHVWRKYRRSSEACNGERSPFFPNEQRV